MGLGYIRQSWKIHREFRGAGQASKEAGEQSAAKSKSANLLSFPLSPRLMGESDSPSKFNNTLSGLHGWEDLRATVPAAYTSIFPHGHNRTGQSRWQPFPQP
jgi:hypothetical protein